jgi:hypothetical protein
VSLLIVDEKSALTRALQVLRFFWNRSDTNGVAFGSFSLGMAQNLLSCTLNQNRSRVLPPTDLQDPLQPGPKRKLGTLRNEIAKVTKA